MKKSIKLLLLALGIVLVYVFIHFVRGTRSLEILNSDTKEKAQDILVSTAMAYKYRGSSVRYDDGRMTYRYSSELVDGANAGSTDYADYKRWSIHRPGCGFSPEDATYQDIQYASCSPWLLSVYYDAFNGYVIHSKNNGNNVETSNSNHWVFMANPIRNDYYNSDVAVYNLAIINNDGNNSSYTFEEAYQKHFDIVESRNNHGLVTQAVVSTTQDTVDKLKEYLRTTLPEILEVGDIIGYTYRYNEGSHVLMYIGRNDNDELQFIHSYIGNTYNYSAKKDVIYTNGAIAIWTLDELLDKEDGSYSIFSKRTYTINGESTQLSLGSQVSIIRPLNDILGKITYATVTDKMQARYDHPGLVRTKTASVNKYDSVNPGDLITYTIKLKNNDSDIYNNLEIRDTLPNNTTYINCDNSCTKNGNTISWSGINLSSGATKTYKFTVRVNEDTPLGTIIVSDQTYADNIKLNTIKTTVNKTLSASMQEELVAIVNEWADTENINNTKYSVTRSFIQAVYDALGIEWFNFGSETSSSILLNHFYTKVTDGAVKIENDSLSYYNTYVFNKVSANYNERDQYQKLYVDELYGGYFTPNTNPVPQSEITFNKCLNSLDRSKVFNSYTLMVGDVVVMYDKDYDASIQGDTADSSIQVSGPYNMYFYIGNGNFATIPEYDPKITIFNNKYDGRSRFLDAMLGQTAFVVLRPSYAITSEIPSTKGDVNLDGNINITDAEILANYIIDKTSNYSDGQILLGDMNNDGIIKMNDVKLLLNNILN